MAVQLQIAEGKIKKYKTVYEVGNFTGDLYYYTDKWVANCGREWKDKPKEGEECDHLDCAIYLAEQQNDGGPKAFVFLIVIAIAMAILLYVIDQRIELVYMLIFPGVITLVAFHILIVGIIAGKRFDELTEYRDKGTINGTKASQIFDVS